jgi:ribosomal protein L16/L10AE
MRGAYGKPNGLAARVTINQIMFSIRTTLKGEEHAVEALRKVISPASSLPPGTSMSVPLLRGKAGAGRPDGAAWMIGCA